MRVADRDDQLADTQAFRVAERGRSDVTGSADDREVGQRVGADQLELELAAVGERGAPSPFGAGDDVGRREHEPVRGNHHAAPAGVVDAAAPDASRQAQIAHRG